MRRKQVSAGYYQVNAIRTILVEENFGDFNEKAFDDIRTFEEVHRANAAHRGDVVDG